MLQRVSQLEHANVGPKAGATQDLGERLLLRAPANLQSVRPAGAEPPKASLELLGYSLIGALHDAVNLPPPPPWGTTHRRRTIRKR